MQQPPEMCGASSWNYNRHQIVNNGSQGQDEDVDGQSRHGDGRITLEILEDRCHHLLLRKCGGEGPSGRRDRTERDPVRFAIDEIRNEQGPAVSGQHLLLEEAKLRRTPIMDDITDVRVHDASRIRMGDEGSVLADDVEVAMQAGLDVKIIAGHEENIKITLPEDFERASNIMKDRR